MPSFWEKGRFAVVMIFGWALVSAFQPAGAFSQESAQSELVPPTDSPSAESASGDASKAVPPVETGGGSGAGNEMPQNSEGLSEDPSPGPVPAGEGGGEIPGQIPEQIPMEDSIPGDSEAAVKKPPVELSLLEAIETALKGNRGYLDRVDRVREGFGIGQVDLEREVALFNDATGETTLVNLPGETSGLAATQTQFQTSISPTVGLSRSKGEGSSLSGSESYGLSLSKRFQTGGNLSVSSQLGTSEFDDPSSSMSVSFSQPLLRNAGPLVVLEPVNKAKSDLRKQEQSLECCDSDSRQGLIFEVISNYYSILNQRELVIIAETAVERAEKLYRATAAKLSVDLATQLDVSRAEVQLSGQKISLNQSRQELGNLEEKFKVLLGLDTRSNVILTDPVIYNPGEKDKISEENLEMYIATALEHRSDLKVAQIQVEDAERQLKIAKRNFLPNLGSGFGYTVSNVGGLTPDSDPNSGSWSANLSLSYPLPIGGAKINVANRTISLQREKRRVIQNKEEIIQQIKTDVRNVVQAQAQITIVQEEIRGAEKKLKISNFRFTRGLSDNFDVVDAENNLIRARQNLTRTINNYKVALAQLKKDMGVLKNDEL